MSAPASHTSPPIESFQIPIPIKTPNFSSVTLKKFNLSFPISLCFSLISNPLNQMESGGGDRKGFDQNVIVMRHGDRMDNFDPAWVTTAPRPWDPPLAGPGRVRAFSTGRELRAQLGFPIHRLFVSPFLRCVETASEVVSALCAVADDVAKMDGGDGVEIDASRVKVSIEPGLCEMLNTEAVRPDVAPKDGNFDFQISDLEALLPSGTVDHSVERVYAEVPRWPETVMGARTRYEQVIRALADKYPSQNLLLVTHGECVGDSFSAFMKGAVVYEVNYCAHLHARRRVVFDENGSFSSEVFQLVPGAGQTGIRYYVNDSMSDGV